MRGTAEAATADPGTEPEQYVINLCASTTPMALVQPKSDALKRFTFFVSRRREDGRERFRLHMGYFGSAEEAEEWLGVVRELYPAAWVGEAPGRKLRAAARVAAAEPATAAPEPATAAPEPAAPAAPEPALARSAPTPMPEPAPAPEPELTLAPEPQLALAPEPVPVAPAARGTSLPDMAALSNVREVLAELDEAPRAMPAPPRAPEPAPVPARASTPAPAPAGGPVHTLYVPPPPVLPEHIPTVQALTPPPMVAQPRRLEAQQKDSTKGSPKAPPQAPPQAPLSDTQVLRVLEERRADQPAVAGAQTAEERAAHSAIELLRPDDTRTMRALKDEVQQNAAVQFAVQLEWSVTPIDLAKVPPLAIFSAYTLYAVESSREGRKWYGLRLGFFSDALSAKQVAYYVRSDFASVAVVPVTGTERDRAIEDSQKQPLMPRKRAESKPSEEFKLFDAEPVPKPPAPSAQAVRARLAAAAQPGRRAAGATRPRPAPRKPAKTLEESLEQTLEILGASELEIDKGRGELLNDTGVRHLSVKVDKRTSTFSKLLDRLSDRLGKD
ncbi:MAG: hypothetical protein KF790_08430 [Steroidobacteraceae bacterium]|nr:hypothetical protein [Steroidobacteraceae bacterium]